ncbi:hypothetical protein INT45_000070 [Circinella minor]|uniref:PH domain-containing protein n=1 Tax=Circinella minor TaxID=1195481 RepID=A0A8H7VS18_9FUNG|nr:hypothetical protein INT45_000070 [Circinella minor]
MVEVKKRNSLTSFGLRIIGRSNSTKASKNNNNRPPTTASNNTRRRTVSTSSIQKQQTVMTSPVIKQVISETHLANKNNNRESDYNPIYNQENDATEKQPLSKPARLLISSYNEEQIVSPTSPDDNHKEKEEIEIPKTPTSPVAAGPGGGPTSEEEEDLEYTNITLNVQGNNNSIPRNRAQPIILRMNAWQIILREILIWLEQVGRINLQSSELYYNKVLPHVDWKDKVMIKQETPMASMLQGFRSLTSRVASTQKSAGNKLFKEYIPELENLAKEGKRRIQMLEQNRQFRMDELLKRADITQKTLALLAKQCQAAETTGGQVAQDPWVTNLHVLRYLQREVQEDNRLRTTMIDIQHQSALFEKRVIHTLKKTMQFCYDHYGNIATSRETARMQRMIEKMDTEREWQQFLNSEAKDLVVNPLNTSRDYFRIHYNNKFHPAVMTLAKGSLERRTGSVRKQYTERYYVLTQCGFLHQFHENDKVNPELSIFIPKSTIIPSIDMSHLSTQYHQHLHPSGDEYTFEIRRSSALQRDKVYILRARSREELIGWCQLLIDVATRTHHGHSATWKKIQRKSTMLVNEEGQEQEQQDPVKTTTTTTTTTTTVHRSISNASSKYTKSNPILQQQKEEDTVLLQSPTSTPSSPVPQERTHDTLAKARSTITSIIDNYDDQKKFRNNSNNDNDTQNVKKLDKGKSRSKDLPERIELDPPTANTEENTTDNTKNNYDNYLNSRAQVVEPGHAVHAQLQHKNTFPPQPIHSNSNNSISMNTNTTTGMNEKTIDENNQKTPTRESIPVMHAITTDIPTMTAGSVERLTSTKGNQGIIDNSKERNTSSSPIINNNYDKQESLSIHTTNIKESTIISNNNIKQQSPSMIMSPFVSYLPQLTTFSSQKQYERKNNNESTISNRSSQSFESFSEDIRH